MGRWRGVRRKMAIGVNAIGVNIGIVGHLGRQPRGDPGLAIIV